MRWSILIVRILTLLGIELRRFEYYQISKKKIKGTYVNINVVIKEIKKRKKSEQENHPNSIQQNEQYIILSQSNSAGGGGEGVM